MHGWHNLHNLEVYICKLAPIFLVLSTPTPERKQRRPPSTHTLLALHFHHLLHVILALLEGGPTLMKRHTAPLSQITSVAGAMLGLSQSPVKHQHQNGDVPH